MDDIRNDGAKWRTLVEAQRAKVEEYERKRKTWLLAQTSGEYAHAEAEMNKAAREVVGYLSLLMGVSP